MKARSIFRHFNRAHLYTFLGFYLLFAGSTYAILARQSESDWRENWNTAASLGAVSGPFTGAIARRLQPCCLDFSLRLLPYCAAILLGGTVVQLVPLPFQRIERPLRLLAWVVGLLGWFGGGLISFAHALS